MDLKIDYAFKQLFGVERNKDLTIVFLNAVLDRKGKEKIQRITFKNTEFSGELEEDKKSRLRHYASSARQMAPASWNGRPPQS
ncbi:PD-(D/E)XK nuclease family transposase [Salibacterium qingdaonense]|nr:PD-(D/E)XK nuclease family transposase [Salibacterium qingdaonense]